MRWEFLAELDGGSESQEGSIRREVFQSLRRMIAVRKSLPPLAGQNMELIATGNSHVLGFLRFHESHRLIVLANFCERPQSIAGNALRTAGLGRFFEDAISSITYPTSEAISLEPYQIAWLRRV
jgi:amylosucrase